MSEGEGEEERERERVHVSERERKREKVEKKKSKRDDCEVFDGKGTKSRHERVSDRGCSGQSTRGRKTFKAQRGGGKRSIQGAEGRREDEHSRRRGRERRRASQGSD